MVSWIKPNGQSVAGKVLELMSINKSEAGEYTCEASNECSNATEMASIDVQCKHIIFKHHYHIVVDPVEKKHFLKQYGRRFKFLLFHSQTGECGTGNICSEQSSL